MVGTWSYATGMADAITQDSSGNLTVTETETPCGGGDGPCTYTGTGTLNLSTGAFSYSLSTTEDTLVVNGGGLDIYPVSISYTGTMDETGCNDLEASNMNVHLQFELCKLA